MKHRKDQGKEYIQAHPQLKKWINVCICCGTWGYKTELPEWLYNTKISSRTVGAQYIRKYFNPMDVNDLGNCEQCQGVIGSK